MKEFNIGFIGGGRAASILLGGLKKSGQMPHRIVVSDADSGVLEKLKTQYPEITPALNGNKAAAEQDIVFLALHPPAIQSLEKEVWNALRASALLVSLAPKIRIARLADMSGNRKVARMIPNAPSIIGRGYNPVTFSADLAEHEKNNLLALFAAFGEAPIVAEEKLEAYAILTAMGPTYLWFQLCELEKLAVSFGLSQEETARGISAMVRGAVDTLYGGELTATQVIDLVPVKPLGEDEEAIRQMYRARLTGIHKRLTG